MSLADNSASDDTPTEFTDCSVPLPWWPDEKVEALNAWRYAKHVRKLTDRSQPYMRNAHLLPPLDEFSDVDWYVAVLKLFDRAPATLPMYRFNPTPAQRLHNDRLLMKWEEQERLSRAAARGNVGTDRRLEGWLESTFRNVVNDVASQPHGSRNTRLRWAARRLAELGFDETRCKQALMDASAPWDYNEAGRRQSRATFKSGWDKGIANPVDLSVIEAALEGRDD
jgi:hypothetical protein